MESSTGRALPLFSVAQGRFISEFDLEHARPVVVIGNAIAESLFPLIDPIGTAATGLITRYWSLADKNTRLVPLADELLWNRALWLSVRALIFAACYARFRMSYAPRSQSSVATPRCLVANSSAGAWAKKRLQPT